MAMTHFGHPTKVLAATLLRAPGTLTGRGANFNLPICTATPRDAPGIERAIAVGVSVRVGVAESEGNSATGRFQLVTGGM